MELRHLRYFVAVAEERSLSIAAEKRLHTAQPSLSRQMRDLEHDVGAQLLSRSSRGVELTHAGKVFLEHARVIIKQVEIAAAETRRAAQPRLRTLAIGFLSGTEPQWLPAVTHVLREELPQIEISLSSKHSPQLADELSAGMLDAAFMRPEENRPELAYHVMMTEPLIVVLPSDHRLASKNEVHPADLVGESFVGMADQAPVVRKITDDYLDRHQVKLLTRHRVEYLSMAVSVVASTRSIAFLPSFARDFLTWSVVGRPLADDPPKIDLVLGCHRENRSPILALLLARRERLIDAAMGKAR